jgi:sensor domain CHASE-containing protein
LPARTPRASARPSWLAFFASAWGLLVFGVTSAVRGLLCVLPHLVGVGFTVAALVLWQAFGVQDQARIRRLIQVVTLSVQCELEEKPSAAIPRLISMAGNLNARDRTGGNILDESWTNYLVQYSACEDLALLDAACALHWEKAKAMRVGWEGRVFGDGRQEIHGQLRNRKELMVRRAPHGGQGASRFLLVYVPVNDPSGKAAGVLGVFRTDKLLDAILHSNVSPGYGITVLDGDEPLYTRRGGERE